MTKFGLIACSALALCACEAPDGEFANSSNEISNETVMPTESDGMMPMNEEMANENGAAPGGNASPRASVDPDTPVSSDDDDQCGAGHVRAYVGREATPTVRAEIAAKSKAGAIRWIEPGMAVTMDFRPDRLNAELDAQGRIIRLNCS